MVCPTDSIVFGEDRKPKVQVENCAGCSNCVEHCPKYAVSMEGLETPRTIFCDPSSQDKQAIAEICKKAHFFPKQEICVCTRTTAEEVAAAILSGAKTPIDLSRMTGIRTGCKCCCAETPLRMLNAAGIDPGKAPGYQWYGLTQTLWTISDEVKQQNDEKFRFSEDKEFYEHCLEKGVERS
jgi:bacterioferritin-associated ferredoxin